VAQGVVIGDKVEELLRGRSNWREVWWESQVRDETESLTRNWAFLDFKSLVDTY